MSSFISSISTIQDEIITHLFIYNASLILYHLFLAILSFPSGHNIVRHRNRFVKVGVGDEVQKAVGLVIFLIDDNPGEGGVGGTLGEMDELAEFIFGTFFSEETMISGSQS